jgi:transcription-repair coupling factor (superfamily II helicase)
MLGGADGATRVRLLTGSMGAKARNASLLDAASGEAGIVIGTHALIQDHVQFAELGLLVVDEQHRFGVEQRAALVDRADVKPHVLVMTATPIPRTIAMTVFGDLEVSTLRELPAGRQPIQTTVVPRHRPGSSVAGSASARRSARGARPMSWSPASVLSHPRACPPRATRSPSSSCTRSWPGEPCTACASAPCTVA